jgi:MFS transporter, PAT family, beta-lactamase induction signal transducer AmpG
MSTIDSPSAAAVLPRDTLGDALRDRSIWLLFVLGLATGIPVSWGWYQLVAWPGFTQIEWSLWLPLTHFGIVSAVVLIVAPFLDSGPAPLFRGLGHRRSWVALTLSCALVLMVVLGVIGALVPHRALAAQAAIGIIALPVAGLLWISIDALRIEARPGREQAYAVAAQYIGALLASGIVSRFGGDAGTSAPMAIAFTVLLAAGLGAVFLLRGERASSPTDNVSALLHLARTLTAPWRAFFAQHGAASGLLLAAIALYAIAGSAAEHLGKNGHLYEIIDPTRPDADSDRHVLASQIASPFELVVSLLAGVAAMFAAARLAPARAFAVLQFAVVAVTVFFLACKLVFGFTVITVGLLYALRAMLISAAMVIYAVVAARLTARPNTAGQYAMLGLFVSLFWLSETGLNWIGPMLGSYVTAGGAIAASVAALFCMRAAARIVRRGPVDRG